MVPDDDAMRCVSCGHYAFPERAEPRAPIPFPRTGTRYKLGPRQTPGNRRQVGRRL